MGWFVRTRRVSLHDPIPDLDQAVPARQMMPPWQQSSRVRIRTDRAVPGHNLTSTAFPQAQGDLGNWSSEPSRAKTALVLQTRPTKATTVAADFGNNGGQ